MKKIYLLCLAFAICTTAFSQNFLGMKIKKFGISTTTDQDRVNNLNADYFDGLSKQGFSDEIMENDFDNVSLMTMICENPAIRADITVLPFRTAPNFQLNMGTSLMLGRLDGTDYGFYNWRNDRTEYLSFNSTSNELALDGSLVYHQKLWFLNLYGGAGSNIGYTYAGDIRVRGSYYEESRDGYPGTDGGETVTGRYVEFNESHDMKNSLHQRVFLHGGLSVILFKRVELGMEVRRGVGYRYNTGNPLKFTDLMSSGFNLRWNLK